MSKSTQFYSQSLSQRPSLSRLRISDDYVIDRAVYDNL
jgi:hypothetical protein